jgi:hypothetical protein
VSDDKVIIQLEITPDDELVTRNAVSGEVIFQEMIHYNSRYERGYAVERVVTAIRRELTDLIVNQDDEVSERYT